MRLRIRQRKTVSVIITFLPNLILLFSGWKSQHRLKTSLQKGDEPIGDIFDEVHMVGASDPEHFTEFRDLVYQFDDDEEDCWRKIRHKLKHANLRMPKMPMPHRY